MKLVLQEGPVHAPAFFDSRAPQPWRIASRRARGYAPEPRTPPRRRPIGLGARTVVVTDPAAVARPRLHPVPPAGKTMKRTTLFATLLFTVTASVAAMGISAAVDTPRSLMSRDDYRVALRGIQSATRLALAECRGTDMAARDICKARVRADERVRKAELDARYYGTVSAAEDVQVARIKARYDVARAQCGVLASSERLQCLRTAREARAKEIQLKTSTTT